MKKLIPLVYCAVILAITAKSPSDKKQTFHPTSTYEFRSTTIGLKK